MPIAGVTLFDHGETIPTETLRPEEGTMAAKRQKITADTEIRGYPVAVTKGPKDGLFNVYVDFGPDTPWTPHGEVESASYPVSYFDGSFVGVDSLTSEAEAHAQASRLIDIYEEHARSK